MEQVQASSRYGTILFFLATVLLLSTAFLNKSFFSSMDRYVILVDRYHSIESMLGKARLSGLREENFFSAVSLQILSSEWLLKTGEKIPDGPGLYHYRSTSLPDFNSMRLVVEPESGDFWVRSPRMGYSDFLGDPFFRQLRQEVGKLGVGAKEIDRLTVSAERKIQLLDATLDASLSNKDAREILADDLAEIIIHNKKAARNIRCWIVFDSWSCPGDPVRVFGDVSYLKRDERMIYWSPMYIEDHIFTAIGTAKDQDEIETILNEEWTQAYHALREFEVPAAQVSLPGTGITLTANDILLLAGPLLIFFQVLFLIFKEKIAASENDKLAFAFPQFSSPDDPLRRPLVTGIAEFGERGIWLLFLILPILILTIAVVARYDFSVIAESSGAEPWLAVIGRTRSRDWFSTILDLVNLGALSAALLVGVRLTTLHQSPIKRFPERIRRILAVFALLAIFVTLIAAGWNLLGTDTGGWGLFFVAFTLIWGLGFYTALIRGAWTMSSISVAGFVLGLTVLFG